MNILIDTKEKIPYTFSSFATSAEFIHTNVHTGDYTIKGLEDIICIERKKNVAELAGNVTQPRFIKELKRMSEIKHSFLLLEFSYFDIDIYPEGSDLPKKVRRKLKIKGPYIMSFLANIPFQYGVHIYMCGNRDYAEHTTYKLLEKAYKHYGN